MSSSDKKTMSKGLTRRDALKLSGLALGGLAFTGSAGKAIATTSKYGGGNPNTLLDSFYPTHNDTQRYTYFEQLKPIIPCGKDMEGNLTGTKLEPDEMRITFCWMNLIQPWEILRRPTHPGPCR
ncbi:MAG: hypothetical protein LWX51_14700 [Deltaproteobacteria bacterium]|jgi:ribonuclease Z|nr:hypothetical protein [Deltaproteobacteria bacterium]